jgi:uncharacterized protein YjbJ (UPF0337 family)
VTAIPTSAPGSAGAPTRKEAAVSNFDQAKGKIKQAAGDLTDDRELRKEGQRDEQAGKVKEALGKAKDKLDDAVDKVRDKANDR